jgi:glycosyltransferase involved in cell wall biosynthesis
MKPGVLFLLDSFEQGGTERQALQMVRSLAGTGRYRPHVACLHARGALHQDAKNLEIPIFEYPIRSFRGASMARELTRFASDLRRHRIDILQTTDFYTNVFGLMAGALAGVPVRIGARRQSAERTLGRRLAVKASYLLAHAIVANGDALRRQLLAERVSARKIVVVPNGVDLDRVQSPADADRSMILGRLGLPKGRRFVTLVANLRLALKDHPTFLRAAQRAAAVVPDAAFVVAGEGKLLPAARRLAIGLGLQRRAFFMGRCDRIAELLAVSDVCVLSSRAEGSPNVLLEYAAAGRPIVTTDVGAAREVVVDGVNGFVVRPGDDEAMGSAMATLLQTKALAQRMGNAGRARIVRDYSCDAQLARLEALYDRLLRNARCGRLADALAKAGVRPSTSSERPEPVEGRNAEVTASIPNSEFRIPNGHELNDADSLAQRQPAGAAR